MINYEKEKKELCAFFVLLNKFQGQVTFKQLDNSGFPNAEDFLIRLQNSSFVMNAQNNKRFLPFKSMEIINDGFSFVFNPNFINMLNIADKWEVWDIENLPDADDIIYNLRNITTAKPSNLKKQLIYGFSFIVVLAVLFTAYSFFNRPNGGNHKAFIKSYLAALYSSTSKPIDSLKLDNVKSKVADEYTVDFSFSTAVGSEPVHKRVFIALAVIDNLNSSKENKEPSHVFTVREYKELELVETEKDEL